MPQCPAVDLVYQLFDDCVYECCMSDDLLPLVHCVWKSFVRRFSDEEPLVTIKVSPQVLLSCRLMRLNLGRVVISSHRSAADDPNMLSDD